ncbi:MAG: hypothetical protein N3F07_01110 [Candidatus Micrarchaeota archaeon]|nr:hypothetical protein [Candidatus Micrarchaeota archaeon]
MAAKQVVLFLALISAAFSQPTQELNVSLTSVEKLVDYSLPLQSSQLIPGVRYDSSILVSWAAPDSSLSGLEGRTILVKVSASISNDSDVFFVGASGAKSKSAEAYLKCAVKGGICSNGSVLKSEIPLQLKLKENESLSSKIRLKAEILEDEAPALTQISISEQNIQESAGSIFESIKKALENSTEAKASMNEAKAPPKDEGKGDGHLPQLQKDKDLLSELKPEGNAKNPMEFLQANPVISIAAFAVVVIITGAYLLNSKD